eukprot:SM000055S18304  [mRNA]  locus=s55:720735:728409:- [translate_table: standard]
MKGHKRLSGRGRLPSRSSRARPRRVSLPKALLIIFGVIAVLLYNVVLRYPSILVGRNFTRDSATWLRTCPLRAGQEAVADITTKTLYDNLAFDNAEGGVWRQGWNVKYEGTEWDEEKLQVFVVPHSHNDPGWLRTVEEYYNERTRNILNVMVAALKQDRRRKFIWEEISYLKRWWQDATQKQKQDFISLVRNGQLEIVGGGWVMNDEANSHYFAIIDQIMEGNTWLFDNIGIVPKNAWAIDPFGHSPTMAYIYRRMGFSNMLIQRTHYEVKRVLARNRSLEFNWRQAWDAHRDTDMFCHMMPFYSYDAPHSCGPDPAICCQFDFFRMPSTGSGYTCPWGTPPVEITNEDVHDRAWMLLDQYRKKSMLYQTNSLLVPLGDDFRYFSDVEADVQYSNYGKLFDYMNVRSDWNVEAQFGTLEDYFTSVRAKASHKLQVLGDVADVNAADNGVAVAHAPEHLHRKTAVAGFPSLSGDFFTYSDRVQDYWSGYFTSRPFYKAVDRVLEQTLRATEILFSLSMAYCSRDSESSAPLFLDREAEQLLEARRNLALFQHHDGITGTAKDHVMDDYGRKMHGSLRALQKLMETAITAVLQRSSQKGICVTSALDFFTSQEIRSEHNVLPERAVVEVDVEGTKRVVVYNPLEETAEQVVSIVVDHHLYGVLDSNMKCVKSQRTPQWKLHSQGQSTGKHILHWMAKVPPLGLQTYFLVQNGVHRCMSAEESAIFVYNAPRDFQCPSSYLCHTSPSNDSLASIQNTHLELFFGMADGLLRHAKVLASGAEYQLQEQFLMYKDTSSGAYLFTPNGEAVPIIKAGGLSLVATGPLVHEVYSSFRSTDGGFAPVVRRARLYEGNTVQAAVVEMAHRVELRHANSELVVRYQTGVQSGKVFYSDLNGFQASFSSKRGYCTSSTISMVWLQTIRRETLDKIPLQGNYYPMPSLAFLQGANGARFSVHSRQAVGVASLQSGWLEMMLDRRLLSDDNRGLGQGVTDNHPVENVLHLLLESNSSRAEPLAQAASPLLPSLLSHRVGAQLNYPLHIFVGRREAVEVLEPMAQKHSAMRPTFAPLRGSLPCDFHIVNMKVHRPLSKYQGTTDSDAKGPEAEPRTALLLQRRGWDCAYSAAARPGRMACSATLDGRLGMQAIFSSLIASDFWELPLSLVHKEETLPAEALDGHKVGEADSSASTHRKDLLRQSRAVQGSLQVDPMEIVAVKFDLAL